MSSKDQSSFTYDELISCAKGQMFGPGNPQLPLPPMLMCDRITRIDDNGGEFGKGQIDAEFDLNPDLWFFPCHFDGDPVMPGCLGMDALWQLVGFFLGWSGGLGRGRALSVGEVKFTGQILPSNKLVTFRLDMKRVIASGERLTLRPTPSLISSASPPCTRPMLSCNACIASSEMTGGPRRSRNCDSRDPGRTRTEKVRGEISA